MFNLYKLISCNFGKCVDKYKIIKKPSQFIYFEGLTTDVQRNFSFPMKRQTSDVQENNGNNATNVHLNKESDNKIVLMLERI